MKTYLLSSLVIALSVPAVALACEGEHGETKASIGKLTVQQLAKLIPEQKISPVDANGAQTREKFGSIPGAILLTSASQYDTTKELPANKGQKLVFYCASTKCNAAETAAKRALEAGYTDVNVLPVGISGWKESGQKTTLANKS